jgi:hypothetical protein
MRISIQEDVSIDRTLSQQAHASQHRDVSMKPHEGLHSTVLMDTMEILGILANCVCAGLRSTFGGTLGYSCSTNRLDGCSYFRDDANASQNGSRRSPCTVSDSDHCRNNIAFEA